MNATETIQAAIDKLERLPVSVTPWRDVTGFEIFVEGTVVAEFSGEAALLTDAETIVTLHRTIDAQLAILQLGMEKAYPFPATFPASSVEHAALGLARAILGES